MDRLAASQPLEAELVPARMLNELVYCPRLFHLEWVQQEWASSADTLGGDHDHRRVDVEQGSLPDPEELGEGRLEARSVMLSAPGIGIAARMDLVQAEDGGVVPVDYKHGHGPDGDQAPGLQVWDPDRIQVAAQVLVLRENGYRCERGLVYYVASKRKVAVDVDEALELEVRDAVQRARDLALQAEPPPPLIDSPKCPRCSLVGICLPDEQRLLTADEQAEVEVRRLYPARTDALPVYVQTQGAHVGKGGDTLEISERDKGKQRVRLIDVSQLALFGNVQVTTQAIQELLNREVPISYFSMGGWFYGITRPIGARNCAVRVHQYRHSIDRDSCLDVARGLVARKVRNCRTLLRRNAEPADDAVLEALERFAHSAERTSSLEALLGIEGSAARAYFGAFRTMLRPPGGTVPEFDFEGRNRRPPKDPVNALLSLAYSVLAKDWTVSTLAVGLDPFIGLYHRQRFGRPALALDLMEEFRPLIADSVVLQVINNGEVQPSAFLRRGTAVALTNAGRRSFFLAYERRMNHLVRHPTFGYRVSYRRLLEVQSRLFARFLSGGLLSYDGFRTR
jgi:CRISPR-associated protein Cas1